MVAHLQRILTDPHPQVAGEERGGGTGHRRRFLIALLATFVAAEIAARLLSPLLPPANAGMTGEFDRMLERLDARAEPIDTFVIGASEVAVAIDPEALERGTGTVDHAHTIWMPGIGVGTVAAMTRDVVLAHRSPERLIIGITSREANAGDLDRQVRDAALLDSLSYRKVSGEMSPLDRVDERATQLSALVRERDGLRSPLETARHLVRNGTTPVPALEVNEHGMHTDRLDVLSYTETPGHYAQEQAALANFELDAAGLAQLEAVLTDANAAGTDVVLVQLPVYERHYFELQPGLAEQDARFVRAVEELATRSAVTYLDPRNATSWDDPTLWADVNHLNGDGTAKLTDWLAAQLDA